MEGAGTVYIIIYPNVLPATGTLNEGLPKLDVVSVCLVAFSGSLFCNFSSPFKPMKTFCIYRIFLQSIPEVYFKWSPVSYEPGSFYPHFMYSVLGFGCEHLIPVQAFCAFFCASFSK